MERSVDGGGSVLQDNIFANIPVEVPAAVTERVVIHPASVARALASVIIFLVLMSFVTHYTGVADQIFMLDHEQNVPTYFSTVILLTAAALLSLIATLKRRRSERYSLHWTALSLIFLYMSMDELVGLHEMVGSRLGGVGSTTGPFYYASTIFTLTMVVLVGLSFFRFLLHLPRSSAMLFVAAGGLYVTGALGMEMIGGMVDQSVGTTGILYLAVTTLEETCEMAGVVLFIYALLHYLSTALHEPRLQISRHPG